MAPASGVSNAKLRELRQAQDIVEMQQSSFGAGDVAEHRTREGYKDKQKRKAFDRLETVCDRLRVAEGTLTRAKGFFAGFRDNREHVQKFDEAVAAGACVCVCAPTCSWAAPVTGCWRAGSVQLRGRRCCCDSTACALSHRPLPLLLSSPSAAQL